MTVRVIKEADIEPVHVIPGDRLILVHKRNALESTPQGWSIRHEEKVVLEHTVTRNDTFDRAGILTIEEEFGIERGIGGFFGKRIRGGRPPP